MLLSFQIIQVTFVLMDGNSTAESKTMYNI